MGRSPGVVCAGFHEKACRGLCSKWFTIFLFSVRCRWPSAFPDDQASIRTLIGSVNGRAVQGGAR